MIHFRRYLAALFVLTSLWATYALAVAPWIEPPPISPRRAETPAKPPLQPTAQVRADLIALFDEKDWERDETKVKVIETEQATVLIQDYLPTEDGNLELFPCTIIFYSTSGPKSKAAGATGARPRRPIVLRSKGAKLEFDHPLDLARSQLGKMEKGTLAGPITIFSPPTDANSRDGLMVTTRHIWLDRGRIFTPHEVEFRYGDSHGSGRDLTIALLQNTDELVEGAKHQGGGVQSLTLGRLDRLHLAAGGGGLLGDGVTNSKPGAPERDAPLELTCEGPFTFDMVARRARFEDQVLVERVTAGSPPDRLRCDELLLEFASREATEQQPEPKTGNGMLAGQLARMVALGRPAVLEAPARGVSASAAYLEYAPASRRIALKSEDDRPGRKVTQVSLKQLDQHFVARQLQYELPEAGRLGRLWAEGPGELRMIQGTGAAAQPIVARWEKTLHVRPDGQNQAISLVGAASITAESQGRFDADELHMWVLEVAAQPGTDQPRASIIPDRLLASGAVRVTSPQLDLKTGRLEAWFIHRPLSAMTPIAAATGRADGPASQVTYPVTTGPVTIGPAPISEPGETPSLQKFQVTADLVKMQVVVKGQEMELEDLTLDGQALIDETRTPQPGQEPFHVVGKSVEFRRGTSPQATLQVVGQPALVAGRGLDLKSGTIDVHRGRNELTINGPGEATLPVPENAGASPLSLMPRSDGAPPPPRPQAPGSPRPPQKLHVNWEDRLVFDGQVVKLSGQVHCRTATQLAIARTLEATLTRRVALLDSSAHGEQPDLARLKLDGDVLVKNWGRDENGVQTSLDQAQVPTLTIDRLTGKLHADGPGWVSSVRRGSPMQNQPGQPTIGPLAPQPGDDQPLTSVHVSFFQAVEGDLNRHTIQFQGQVNTTYSPARDFTDVIVAKRLTDLGPRGVLMTSDRLTVIEMGDFGTRWLELMATGNTHIEGRMFTVQAALVSYNTAKEVLTIEGDGRADAHIWLQSAPGQPADDLTMKKCHYNLRTGEFTGDGFTTINLRNVRGGIPLGPTGQK